MDCAILHGHRSRRSCTEGVTHKCAGNLTAVDYDVIEGQPRQVQAQLHWQIPPGSQTPGQTLNRPIDEQYLALISPALRSLLRHGASVLQLYEIVIEHPPQHSVFLLNG